MSDLLPKVAMNLTDEQRQQLTDFASACRIVAEKKGRTRWGRSTLSERVAIQMMPYIKHAAQHRRDFEIDIFPGCSLSTMYLKWQGAMQWLIESPSVDQDTKILVSMIKSITKAKKDPVRGKLVIRFVVNNPGEYLGDTKRLRVEAAPEPSPNEIGSDRKSLADKKAELIVEHARIKQGHQWKEGLIEWCQSGDHSVPFIRKGLALTQDDVDFVIALAESAEFTYHIDGTEIRLVRA